MELLEKIVLYLNEEGDTKGEDDTGDYQSFFKKKLKEYGVTSIGDLSDEEQKKLYAEVEKEWKETND